MNVPGNIVDDLSPREFGRLQDFLSPLAIFNIYTRSEPSEDFPGFVLQRIRAEYEPAIRSVETAHSRFYIKGCARSQTRAPTFRQTIAIIRMNCCRPSPTLGLVRGHGCEFKPGTITVIDCAFRRATPKHHRNVIDERAKFKRSLTL